jgi:hypothetical protein
LFDWQKREDTNSERCKKYKAIFVRKKNKTTARLHVIEKPRRNRFFNAAKLPGFLEYATCYVLVQLSSWYVATKKGNFIIFFGLVI